MASPPVIFLSSITSDIGLALAKYYARDGWQVVGTYRSDALLGELKALPGCHLHYCDLGDKASIADMIKWFSSLNLTWTTFISLASYPPPLTPFFESDFEEWTYSVHVNCLEQLRVLHALHHYRDRTGTANVIYFAGPGTNSAVTNFSALTVSKIMLIKMCELLDAENPHLNVFILGPGWVKTKTHDLILADPNVSPEKKAETEEFLRTQKGTPMEDIYNCIRWLCEEGRCVAGGRNFSVVHDIWGREELAEALRQDKNMYKLRRYGNDFKDKWEGKRWM